MTHRPVTDRPLDMEPEQAIELLQRQQRNKRLLAVAGLIGAFAAGSAVLAVAYS